MAYTVTFIQDTVCQGALRAIGSTLSVDDETARMLVDLGAATAAGLSPQTGSAAASFSATFASKANNLSDLTSASSARGNLGLGTMATEAAGNYLAKADNLSGLGSTATARTNLGLGTMATATATDYAALAATNTFTTSQVIEVTDNTNAALRVTQLGTGEAFRVEDSTNPDSTPFVITSEGRVGVGKVPSASYLMEINGALNLPAGNLTVAGSGSTIPTLFVTGSSTRTDTALTVTNAGTGSGLTVSQNNTSATGDCVRITNLGTGASLRVEDSANPDSTPFIIDASGNVGVKNASPTTDLDVAGNAKFTTADITSAPAAGDSSTKVPTTAWVQTEIPAASTSTAGKVQLATSTQIYAGQSTTSVPTTQGASLTAQYAYLKRKMLDFVAAPSVQSSGTGYSYAWLPAYQNVVGAANTAGFTRAYSTFFHPNPLARAYTAFWDGKWGFGQGFFLYNNGATTNGYTLLSRIGVANGQTAGVALPADDTTTKWFGWKYVAGSSIKLQVYDGTTYQETDTGYTPTVSAFTHPVYIVCWSDGAGTAYIEITKPDGSIVTASRTGCPTGAALTPVAQSWVLQLSGTGTQTGAWNVSSTPPMFSADW